MPSTNTLRTAETLHEAGLPERQARAHAQVIEDAAVQITGNLVTGSDLRVVLYRALLIQAGVIVGAVVALLEITSPEIVTRGGVRYAD